VSAEASFVSGRTGSGTGLDGGGLDSPALEWLAAARPDVAARAGQDPALLRAVAAAVGAGPWLARICAHDPLALDVLADLSGPVVPVVDSVEPFERIRRLRDLGVLHIATRDLLGLDDLQAVGRSLSELAAAVLDEAVALAGPSAAGLAVVALGKLGAAELNYSSDIDLILVGPDQNGEAGVDPRPFLELARAAWRVDLDLRPEGRAGPMVRSLASYQAYWSRWAETWEFQALLKARTVAGDGPLGARFAGAAAEQVWSRPFGAEELRQLRHLKARAEQQVQRRNMAERELKLGPGGIRDIEFSLQLLQLVHGRSDRSVRTAATLDTLDAMAAGGYVAPEDAEAMAAAYRFLRTVEHRLQLYEGQPVHTLPRSPERRHHLALVLGYQSDGARSAEQQFDDDLRRHRVAARAIHERLFFRPLLEVFTASPGTSPVLSESAVEERLIAFGFADRARTAQAVSELTRGFSRMSQLMQRMLPLLLDWLSASADPDQGLLGLRILAEGPPSRDRLTTVCRESPVAARQLCQLLGTGPRMARDLQRHPDALSGLAAGEFPAARRPQELEEQAVRSLAWRSGKGSIELGLRQFTQAEHLRIAARDVLGLDDLPQVGRGLSDLADAVICAALDQVAPPVPMAVVGMGRLGGHEVGYDSDVDLLVVWDTPTVPSGEDQPAAEAAALALLRLIGGATPSTGAYRVDLSLRPEGRQGPPARSLAAYEAYFDRWAEPWERQALLRSRFVAGDTAVGAAFLDLVDRIVRDRPFSPTDLRNIRRTKARMERERVPAGEDPKFHLKLGPGSMSDVEWTVQLLQLRHRIKGAGTLETLDRLSDAGLVSRADGSVLGESYRFCSGTRNRLNLIRDLPAESLPPPGPVLSTLARSLGFTSSGLRNEYARVTRRARRVMERLFYGA
jgi:[glutamine synthetase] adenylyltransferase / [glutamine synthetase]-adenylyl-L-tyrosine phosphorylase